ncbi:MAG: hypothetical protein ACFFED_17225 [Candidatus Thorarchaeota archaeon]
MIIIPAALLMILLALIFVPSVVCSRKTEAVVTSAKKVEKEEEPEEEPEESDEEDDELSSD